MNELRLLPLLPSATEIVHALGLGACQVGRSHECDYPPAVRDLPVCSRPAIDVNASSAVINRAVKHRLRAALSIYEIDTDLITKLRPTHIITQTQCEVCAVSLADVERELSERLNSEATVVPLEPHCLADLWTDIRRVAAACKVGATGEKLIDHLQSELDEIRHATAIEAKRPTVAAIEWLEPLMAAGNWIPELISIAGGTNLLGKPGVHSPWLEWRALGQADPDVIIALPCGFDLPRTRCEMHWLTDRPEWNALRAMQNGRVYLCDGNQFMNRPGPRLVESAKTFAEILHPNLFKPQRQGTGWQLLTS